MAVPPDRSDYARTQLDETTLLWVAGLATLHAATVVFDGRGEIAFAQDPTALLQRDDVRRAANDTDSESQAVRVGEWDVRSFVAAQSEQMPLRVVVIDPAHPGGPQDTPISSLEKKNEELETCVRSISHDLRSPLVSVLGFTRLLRDEFGEPIGRTGRHFLDRIEQAGRNMERLLHDMLELSRIDETPNCTVHVSPVAVLEQLAAEKKLPLEEAGIELSFPNEAPIIVCDRTRLYQVFSNLIGNAIQHMEPLTGGRIEVDVTTVADGWEISVADNGPGIPEDDLSRIFEAFQTAKTPTKNAATKKSSGLGLAIVRKIVESHEGRIRVESVLGEGARFIVWLPRASGDETDLNPRT